MRKGIGEHFTTFKLVFADICYIIADICYITVYSIN